MELLGLARAVRRPRRARSSSDPSHLGGAGALAEQAVATGRTSSQRRRRRGGRSSKRSLMTSKGWGALGAFDAAERSPRPRPARIRLASSCSARSRRRSSSTTDDLDLLYGGTTRAQPGAGRVLRRRRPPASRWGSSRRGPARRDGARGRRGDRSRLGGRDPGAVGATPRRPVTDPPRLLTACGARWPKRGVPFMLHVGGGGHVRCARASIVNGKLRSTDLLGGGENIRSKDYMGIYHRARDLPRRRWCSTGCSSSHPDLRGGCIEQGALWVVPLAHAARPGPAHVRPHRARRWPCRWPRPTTCTASSGSRPSRASPSAG